MADVVQWGIDEFWAQLQNLENIAHRLQHDLDQNKLDLQHLWSQSKQITNAKTRAAVQAKLTPLIHQNSVLRVSYLGPIVTKFNQAVAAASAALKKAGYSTPNLSGLGLAIVIAPVAAVTIVVAALALAYVAQRLTAANIQATNNVRDMIARGFTPDQIEKVNKSTPDKPPFDLNGILVPAAIIVGLVVLGPTLARTVERRSA